MFFHDGWFWAFGVLFVLVVLAVIFIVWAARDVARDRRARAAPPVPPASKSGRFDAVVSIKNTPGEVLLNFSRSLDQVYLTTGEARHLVVAIQAAVDMADKRDTTVRETSWDRITKEDD